MLYDTDTTVSWRETLPHWKNVSVGCNGAKMPCTQLQSQDGDSFAVSLELLQEPECTPDLVIYFQSDCHLTI